MPLARWEGITRHDSRVCLHARTQRSPEKLLKDDLPCARIAPKQKSGMSTDMAGPAKTTLVRPALRAAGGHRVR